MRRRAARPRLSDTYDWQRVVERAQPRSSASTSATSRPSAPRSPSAWSGPPTNRPASHACKKRLLAGRTDEYFATAERIGPHLTLQGGAAFARENLRRGEIALKRHEQRAAALGGSARDS
ncbi:hypothetical protein AB0D27_04730 [Streptomyces sp. NPDC048415]|uniref:hypothetical protein n=1 Tax=Streptomyces sp. NPDC048415 TaxID=3154822 RepID=UPI003439446F